MHPAVAHPAVRTFKTRRGRLGPASVEALRRRWPAAGLDVDGRPLDLAARFGRRAPVVLDVGCGDGEASAALAAERPDVDVLAVDVHTAGLAALLRRLDGVPNVRVAEGDALVLLRSMLAPGSLDEVRVLFPDPWPKARHHKRRLVTPAFADLVAARLRPGGRLHVATDWAPYARQVLHVVQGHPRLEGGVVPRPPRPATRYERRALREGRPVVDVVAVLT